MAAESGDRGSDPWPDIIIGPGILITHAQKQAAINGVGWGVNCEHRPELGKKKIEFNYQKGRKICFVK